MKTMNDVNELRELAADACGVASRLHARYESADDVDAVEYGFAMREAGQLAQHARDLEAWVTLRMRITAMRAEANDNKRKSHNMMDQIAFAGDVAAFEKVLEIMNELEGP